LAGEINLKKAIEPQRTQGTQSEIVQCLTNDRSYFEQENTEATETKALISVFPPVKNNTTYLRDTAPGGKTIAGW
jgi:hypothetical protein